jgi:beta-lactamase class A
MLRLLGLIHAGRTGDMATARELRRFLGAQRGRDGIPRFLPPEWTYEGKGGAVDAVRNDVGIVTAPTGRAFAVAVFCDRMPAPLWTPDNPGLLAIAGIAREACRILGEPTP